MILEYHKISKVNYELFHQMMTDYYRDGDDANTAQELIDQMIELLYEQMENHALEGPMFEVRK